MGLFLGARVQRRLLVSSTRDFFKVSTMVLKTESCRFSGLRVYPGHGMTFVRTDSQIFKFLNAKIQSLYRQRLKPSKLAWTFLYRKQHKKDQTTDAAKKKRRVNKTTVSRSIVGASLEVIQ